MHSPSDEERKRIGDKFAALSKQMHANLAAPADGRKRFTPYTDDELRAMYPPREAPTVETAE